jgi:hypothetical protein
MVILLALSTKCCHTLLDVKQGKMGILSQFNETHKPIHHC